ncbi:GPI mannosyltransferase 3 [Lepeophtheirus salmonis]|uniref:GPI mannosyltransferase 3 n=1 Tax=Lepeophtheirus salmonis TaxID=72036 RepID=UPI001AE3B377|nr:GPI mannosyltransferase 3-like [Lepeophtheirus salmonis]
MPLLPIFLLRTFAAIISVSWHVPDEIWQSSEIAHYIVFGYGYKTWEWRDNAEIRSYIHPTLFVPWISLLKTLNINEPYLYILGPRIIQGILSFLGDICLIKAAKLFYERDISSAKQGFYLLYFGNCFMNFCASRPLINTFECTITNIALLLYFRKTTPALVTVLAFGFVVRPTLILFWLPMALFYLMDLIKNGKATKHFLCALTIMFGVFVFTFIFESYMYGHWTFPPWNFFKWNIISGVGSFYGTHPLHWYLSNASLVLWNLALIPIFLSGFAHPNPNLKKPLLCSATFAILGFSLIGHKEHRFILPLLPVFLLFGGQGLALWRSNKLKKMFLFVYVLLNFLAFTYLSLIHQSGSTHVMYPYLRQGLSPPANSTVLFLMPCHSTPYQSYLHRPDVNLRFLTCEPGIGVVDEAEEFYSNPPKWLTENNNKPAEIIILFNGLAVELNKYLVELSYDLQQRIFHSHFGSGRIGEEIWVYRR